MFSNYPSNKHPSTEKILQRQLQSHKTPCKHKPMSGQGSTAMVRSAHPAAARIKPAAGRRSAAQRFKAGVNPPRGVQAAKGGVCCNRAGPGLRAQ
jgi:hypothetical protein